MNNYCYNRIPLAIIAVILLFVFRAGYFSVVGIFKYISMISIFDFSISDIDLFVK